MTMNAMQFHSTEEQEAGVWVERFFGHARGFDVYLYDLHLRITSTYAPPRGIEYVGYLCRFGDDNEDYSSGNLCEGLKKPTEWEHIQALREVIFSNPDSIPLAEEAERYNRTQEWTTEHERKR